jgi:hypothetical protein
VEEKKIIMIDYKPLKTKKIYKETKSWISDSIKFIFEDSQENINKFLNNEELRSRYGTLMVSCSQLSVWYEQSFIVSAFEEDISSQQLLLESLECDIAELFIQEKFQASNYQYRLANPEKQFVKNLFREHGLIFAKCFALGDLENAEWLGNAIINDLKIEMFSSLYARVAQFMLRLFCSWKNIDFPKFPYSDELSVLPDCYTTILETWKEQKSIELENALFEACEFHIEESKYDTQKRYFEFNDHFYRLFPAEILAVIQLRQNLNLETPEIMHPLLQLPTVITPDLNSHVKNELLEKVKQKVVIELTNQ